jgi:transcriptional regulator with XRE-family HTH domain
LPSLNDTADSPKTKAQRLARLRKQRGWTQQRLAAEAACSVMYVGALEQGKRRLDRPKVVDRFARALDCDPVEITGPEPDPAQDAADGCQGTIKECPVPPMWEVRPRHDSEIYLACRRHLARMIHEIATDQDQSCHAVAVEVRLHTT